MYFNKFKITFDCVSAFCAVEEHFWSLPPHHRAGRQIPGGLAGGSLQCASSRLTSQQQSFHIRYISTAYQMSSPSLKISDGPGQQIILRTERYVKNHFMVEKISSEYKMNRIHCCQTSVGIFLTYRVIKKRVFTT